MIVNYNRNNFIVQTTVITIVNYDCKTFIVDATGLYFESNFDFDFEELIHYLLIVCLNFLS